MLEDPAVDMALRVDLIRNAKKSIRIAVYHQSVDKNVGIPIAQALRQAAQRGVSVKFVTSRVPMLVQDPRQLTRKMIADPMLAWPAKYLEFGGFANSTKGWNISDCVHEKIFLIDDKVAIFGGRNQGDLYLSWLDFDVIAMGSGIVGELRKAFDQLWFDVASFAEPLPGFVIRDGDIPSSDQFVDVKLDVAQTKDFADAKSWIAGTKASSSELFEPGRARVVSHRLYNQLKSGKYNGDNRVAVPDSIVFETASVVENAKEIRISMMFALFHPRLKAALLAALSKGASLYLYVNGEQSAGEETPLALTYKDSLSDLVDLLSARQANGAPAKVKIAMLADANRRFLHKKMLIADQHVFFGSHNFNLPSTLANSEIAIQTDDAGFARGMAERFDRDFMLSGRPLTLEKARADYDATAVGRWVAKFLHNFF